MVLQGNAVQSVPLLDISGQVDDVLHPLSGSAPPQPLSATGPQLVALAVLLRHVVLWAIVSKQIGMTAIGGLHHGGWLEPIVLASTGHFFFTLLGREMVHSLLSTVVHTLMRENDTQNMLKTILAKPNKNVLPAQDVNVYISATTLFHDLSLFV